MIDSITTKQKCEPDALTGHQGSEVSPESNSTMFARMRNSILAAIFNRVHAQLTLLQDPDGDIWLLRGPNFLVQLNGAYLPKALNAIFAKNPDEIVADGYVNGDWIVREGRLDVVLSTLWKRQADSNSLVQLIRRLLNNRRFRVSQINSPKVSQGNIQNHYDAENPNNLLFEQLLGSTACYSSAIFDDHHQDLHSAQTNKLRIVREKMNVAQGSRVLDIGCGWGELTKILTESGCDTTGITISHNQLAYCQEKYRNLVRKGKLKFEFYDYRDYFSKNDTPFDSISCIEVLDHIGLKQFNDFFKIVYENLDSDGTFFLQVITRPEPGQTSSWIDKHIYPGGYIASLEEIEYAYSNEGFECVNLENFSGSHYATTLREWRKLLENFRRDKGTTSLFTQRFFRTWEFFLSSSIVAFDDMGFANSHIVLKKTPREKKFK